MFLGIKLTRRSSESKLFSPDLKVILRTWFYDCVRQANTALPSGVITSTQWNKLEQSIQDVKEQSTLFCELLLDGRLLYTLAYVLQNTQNSLQKKDRVVRSIFKANVNRSLHQVTPFHSMERVQLFLRWCREVVELEERYTFTSLELVHDKNETSVCMCLNALRERFTSDTKQQTVPSFPRRVNRKSIEAPCKPQESKRSHKLDEFLNRFTDKVARSNHRERMKRPAEKVGPNTKPVEKAEHIAEKHERIKNAYRGAERIKNKEEDSVSKKNDLHSTKLSAFLKDVPMRAKIPPEHCMRGNLLNNETDTEIDTEEDEGNNILPPDSDEMDVSNQIDAEKPLSIRKSVNLSLGFINTDYDEDALEDESRSYYDSGQYCTSPAMMPLPYSPSTIVTSSRDPNLFSDHEEKAIQDEEKANIHERTEKLRESRRIIEELTQKLITARKLHLKEKVTFQAQLDEEKKEVERLRACTTHQAAEIQKLSRLLESAFKDAQISKDNEEAARHAARIAFAARDALQAQLDT